MQQWHHTPLRQTKQAEENFWKAGHFDTVEARKGTKKAGDLPCPVVQTDSLHRHGREEGRKEYTALVAVPLPCPLAARNWE